MGPFLSDKKNVTGCSCAVHICARTENYIIINKLPTSFCLLRCFLLELYQRGQNKFLSKEWSCSYDSSTFWPSSTKCHWARRILQQALMELCWDVRRLLSQCSNESWSNMSTPEFVSWPEEWLDYRNLYSSMVLGRKMLSLVLCYILVLLWVN